MTVNIVFSNVSGGNSMAETQDSGLVVPGEESDVNDIFVRHDAISASITNCAWYITRCVSPSYLGDDADADIEEVLGWGDNSDGFQINQVPPVSWTPGVVFDDPWTPFSNSLGNINMPLVLDEESIVVGSQDGDGVMPVGSESHAQVRWSLPSDISGGAGYRGLSLVFSYSATS